MIRLMCSNPNCCGKAVSNGAVYRVDYSTVAVEYECDCGEKWTVDECATIIREK